MRSRAGPAKISVTCAEILADQRDGNFPYERHEETVRHLFSVKLIFTVWLGTFKNFLKVY